jgi:hypothetical protein
VTTHGELDAAMVTAESFLDHHPSARFVIAVVTLGSAPDGRDSRIEVRELSDLALGVSWRHLMCTIEERARPLVAQPAVVRALLERAEVVVLLDPRSFIVGPLSSMTPRLGARSGWTITPTRLTPLERSGPFGLDVGDWLRLPRLSAGCMGFDRRAIGALD